jgi:hypothetical protein
LYPQKESKEGLFLETPHTKETIETLQARLEAEHQTGSLLVLDIFENVLAFFLRKILRPPVTRYNWRRKLANLDRTEICFYTLWFGRHILGLPAEVTWTTLIDEMILLRDIDRRTVEILETFCMTGYHYPGELPA